MRLRWLALRHTELTTLVCVLVGASAVRPAVAQNAASGSCVDVHIGSDQAYSCLNRELRKLVPQSRASSADAPINATSPAPEVGTYNQAATRHHLGSNFGISTLPQRPPPPIFSTPLIGHH